MLLSVITSSSDLYQWVILPLLIFLARIADQSIGTLRLIFLSKGMKHIAPLLGFFEVIIWILAIGQIMQHLDNVMCYLAYGAGFAMGNYLGIILEQKISLGTVIIRIILKKMNPELNRQLNDNNYGLTLMDAEGSRGKVKILFSILKRKDLPHFISIMHQFEPDAFYTIEDVKAVNEGVFRNQHRKTIFDSFAFMLKKAK